MKIALCSKAIFSLELGATKNRIELAESLTKLGWETTLVDNVLLGILPEEMWETVPYCAALKRYLIGHAREYDVVLYEYDTLPVDRLLFNETTLFVARPALLAYHLPQIKLKFNLKTKLSGIYRGFLNKFNGNDKKTAAYYELIDYSLSQCDLIQVQNSKDRQLLIDKGFTEDRIIVIPNGITAERLQRFGYKRSYPMPFTLVYVGTFDFRKGAMDFPLILKMVIEQFGNVKLKLLGTKGLFATAAEVLAFFPEKYHASIEVVPKFKASDLPELLKDCHLGIFPSYLESFGFGALEMMAAGLPVIAYDSPGPCDFILNDLLVPVGEAEAFSRKVIALLKDQDLLLRKSAEARQTVIRNYDWDGIARAVDKSYQLQLVKIRKEVARI